MTDRELLEMAAKSAGKGPIISNDGRMVVLGPNSMQRMWAPLDDDGDALRLAVKLDVHVKRYAGSTTAQELCSTKSFTEHDHWSANNNDAMAATRRAIVRAAAAIGEGME